MWSEGIINGFEFKVKHYPEGSQYGIDGGKISKLWISKDGVEVVSYEREWSMRPKTEDCQKVYKELLEKYN